MSEEMRGSWLVQRLNKPRDDRVAEVFGFGGGMKNGGLSEEAMGLIRGIWSFDYMGAAEFEFGAVPKALQSIAVANLTVHTFTIAEGDLYEDKYTNKKPTALRNTLYVICPKGREGEVETRLRSWAKEGYPRMKEQPRVTKAIRPTDEWDESLIGWLELDNGWLAFCDEGAFRKICDLFGLKAVSS